METLVQSPWFALSGWLLTAIAIPLALFLYGKTRTYRPLLYNYFSSPTIIRKDFGFEEILLGDRRVRAFSQTVIIVKNNGNNGIDLKEMIENCRIQLNFLDHDASIIASRVIQTDGLSRCELQISGNEVILYGMLRAKECAMLCILHTSIIRDANISGETKNRESFRRRRGTIFNETRAPALAASVIGFIAGWIAALISYEVAKIFGGDIIKLFENYTMLATTFVFIVFHFSFGLAMLYLFVNKDLYKFFSTATERSFDKEKELFRAIARIID